MIRFLLLLTALPLSAEFLMIQQQFGGIGCTSCASSLEKSLGRMRGVKAVTVDLERSFVRLELEPGNRVSVEELRDRIKNVGFTPGNADVKVSGTLLGNEGAWRIEAKPPGVIYDLRFEKEPARLSEREGKPVIVLGAVPAASGPQPQRILVAQNLE